MTITSYGTGAYRAAKTTEFVATRAQFDDLQRQLSTKRRSESYGDLGIERRASLDVASKLSSIESWLSGIQLGNVNVDLQTKAVEYYAKMTSETRNDLRSNTYVASASGRSSPQTMAEEKFKQTLDLLGTQVNGRYLFSGRTSDVNPVLSYSEIMNGDGAGRAGLTQLIKERQRADLGAGPDWGRVALTSTGATNTTLTEAGGDFGLKLAGATSSNPAAITTARNAVPPVTLSVDVIAQPQAGDVVRLKFALPDGTEHEIELTAIASGATAQSGKTFTIGADTTETATSLRSAIGVAIKREADTTLMSASAMATSTDFFAAPAPGVAPGDPPILPWRVVGTPETATTRVRGTATDTTVWYKGEIGSATDPARTTATVQVDKGQAVAVGARANENVFQTGLAAFAVLANETFPQADPNSQVRYEEMIERAREKLGFGDTAQKPAELITDLGAAKASMAQAKERHIATKNQLVSLADSIENVTTEEVATQILALQNTLQASYQVTAILSKLNLTNYL
jgi:flagellin-like hook-associated protein FlgL